MTGSIKGHRSGVKGRKWKRTGGEVVPSRTQHKSDSEVCLEIYRAQFFQNFEALGLPFSGEIRQMVEEKTAKWTYQRFLLATEKLRLGAGGFAIPAQGASDCDPGAPAGVVDRIDDSRARREVKPLRGLR